jgi:thiazole/oxazole-forming peptide maturase SagD family component
VIRVPAFPNQMQASFVHRDEALLSSPDGQMVVAGPWCGELAARINGRRTRFDLVCEIGSGAEQLEVLNALLRLEECGLLVDAAPEPLDPSAVDLRSPAPAAPDDARLKALADPQTGFVPHPQPRQTAGDFLHVYWTSQPMPAASDRRVGDATRVAVGTGPSAEEAINSCIAEAVERYCLSFQGTERTVHCRAGELDAPAVGPAPLLLISDRQYADRERFNREGEGDLWLPEKPDEAGPMDWTPVWSLTRREKWYVPAPYCFLRYPAGPESFGGDSNGCAAGRTLEDAIVRGFGELVERDAIALWWYNRVPRPPLDLRETGGELAQRLIPRLAQTGRTLHLLDLTNDLELPVVAAISARPDGSAVAFGFGAGYRVARAARRALLEMQQVLGVVESPERSAWLNRWIDATSLDRDTWLAPAAEVIPRARDIAADGDSDRAPCVEIACRHGLELLVANLTRPGVDVPVVRVMAPGLRPAFPRFAPGRLYDVPCALGWREQPLSESELNPFPFFL